MYIDIGVGVTIFMFSLFGMLSGFWGQFLRLAALGSLYFIAPPIARKIEGTVSGYLDSSASQQTVEGVSLIVAAIGLYLVLSILIAIILKVASGGKTMSGANRFGGFLLGGLKGGALMYILLCGLVLVAQSQWAVALEQVGDGNWETHVAESTAVEIVADINLLEEMGYHLPTAEELQEAYGEITGDGLHIPATPTLPNGQVMPGVTQPGITPELTPGVQPAGLPAQPGLNPAVPNNPVQPGVNPIVPVQPGVNPIVPVQPGVNPIVPVQPGVNPIVPVQPGVNPTVNPIVPINPMQPGVNPGVNPIVPINPMQPGLTPPGQDK